MKEECYTKFGSSMKGAGELVEKMYGHSVFIEMVLQNRIYNKEQYDIFVKNCAKIKPETLSLSDFESTLDKALSDFQKSFDLKPEQMIRAVDLVASEMDYSRKDSYFAQGFISKDVTLKKILEKIKNVFSVNLDVEVEGKKYYVGIGQLTNRATDKSANLIIAPFFKKPQEISQEVALGDSKSADNFLRMNSYLFECIEDYPQIKPNSSSKIISETASFFEKFMVNHIGKERILQLSNDEKGRILNVFEYLGEIGFAPQQLRNLTNPYCISSMASIGGFVGYKLLPTGQHQTFSSFREVALFSGKVDNDNILTKTFSALRLVGNSFDRVLGEFVFANITDPHLSIFNKNKECIEDFERNKLGALDIAMILMARRLSFEYSQEAKFNSKSGCFEKMSAEYLASNPDNFFCEDGSVPKIRNFNNPEIPQTTPAPDLAVAKIQISEGEILLKRLRNNIEIEALAMGLRTASEITGRLFKVDEKTRDAIASITENASRLTATGLYYGPSAVLNSLALCATISVAKMIDASVANSGNAPPSQLFQEGATSLVDGIIGEESRQLISAKLSRICEALPDFGKAMARQSAFIFLVYSISSAISESKSTSEEGEKTGKLSLDKEIALGVLTSLASGFLRASGDLLIRKLFSSEQSQSRRQFSGRNSISADLVNATEMLPQSSVEIPRHTALNQDGRGSEAMSA